MNYNHRFGELKRRKLDLHFRIQKKYWTAGPCDHLVDFSLFHILMSKRDELSVTQILNK